MPDGPVDRHAESPNDDRGDKMAPAEAEVDQDDDENAFSLRGWLSRWRPEEPQE
ncbi:hypothetical protein QP027_03850 [Corynebacterium breve]|uniref:Uncharacterized protein n=1 Tax=Corynebacterium breve TaxID=3049799 RepID=A0ABY8VJY2_9CORY|nr:hypothetical protein [Corynebacterium breve]WIM68538.1 hypothetical protein QP027_03850 [Corynebacterium breve]